MPPEGPKHMEYGVLTHGIASRPVLRLHSAAMAPLMRMLCLVACVSFLLAPLSHAHAHITGGEHQHIDVHGGHDHVPGVTPDQHHHDQHADTSDHDATGEQAVMDLAPDLAKPNPGAGKFLPWIAILCVTVLALFVLSPTRTAHPPPRSRARPPSPYPHALPLLRGPPRSI
jgi:hypothetical protein